MNNKSQKVSLREKVGYSFGDGSASIVFQIMILFQLGFYTDVFGIKASVAGMILLIARIVDALIDPLVGVVVDRTNTKWGKFRPWLLWTSIPLGVFLWLAFSTPDISERFKIIYAGFTYTILMALISFNNIPYSALGGVMTSDINERTSIFSLRFVVAIITSFLVQGLTLPLVSKFAHGNDSRGWSITVGIFAIIATILVIISFLATKERIVLHERYRRSVKLDFKDLVSNQPWKVMFFTTLYLFATIALWGGGMYYYFSYYLDKEAIYSFLQNFGLVQMYGNEGVLWYEILKMIGLIVAENQSNAFVVGFSFFSMIGHLITILGVIILSQPLAVHFGKKNVLMIGLFFTAIFTGLFFFVSSKDVGLVFILNVLKSIAFAPTIPLLWAMISDVADYSEWKNARRATGLIFAGIVFALKAGLGFGGAMCGWIVDAFGYIPNVVQDTNSLLGIRLTSSLLPAIIFMAGFFILIKYPITKGLNHKIQFELKNRRINY